MTSYFLTPAVARDGETASQRIHRQLTAGAYAWRKNTPYVRELRPGDRIAFYAGGNVGVVAEAEVTSRAVDTPGPLPFTWRFGVRPGRPIAVPVRIDADLRARLDAFRGKHPKSWPSFVHVTQKITEHDFRLLTDS